MPRQGARRKGGRLRTMTAQLISPAAQTRGSLLHVSVLLRASPCELTVLPPTAVNALWQTVEDWHTLHPVPAHPAGHAHEDEETFPNEVADALETSGRCVAWNMFPPHAGAEHVAPPKPGGHVHAGELVGEP